MHDYSSIYIYFFNGYLLPEMFSEFFMAIKSPLFYLIPPLSNLSDGIVSKQLSQRNFEGVPLVVIQKQTIKKNSIFSSIKALSRERELISL